MLNESKSTAWLFPGQGSQEVGMGSKLLKKFARAGEILTLAEEYAHADLETIIRRGPEEQLTRTDVVQPALTAISCGYVDLMRDAGLQPNFVAGHSLGELAALYAAGVLDLHDVLRLAAERGRLMSQNAVGGMIAVKSCELHLLEELLLRVTHGIACLANLNSPSQLVVSGDEPGLAELTNLVRGVGGEVIRLNVSGAWHSPLVAVAAHEYQKVLATTRFEQPSVPVVMSSVAQVSSSGQEIKTTMLRQMTSAVRWYETIDTLLHLSCREFYEVGAGKVLKGLMRRIVPSDVKYDVYGLDQGTLVDQLVAKISSPTTIEELR